MAWGLAWGEADPAKGLQGDDAGEVEQRALILSVAHVPTHGDTGCANILYAGNHLSEVWNVLHNLLFKEERQVRPLRTG